MLEIQLYNTHTYPKYKSQFISFQYLIINHLHFPTFAFEPFIAFLCFYVLKFRKHLGFDLSSALWSNFGTHNQGIESLS